MEAMCPQLGFVNQILEAAVRFQSHDSGLPGQDRSPVQDTNSRAARLCWSLNGLTSFPFVSLPGLQVKQLEFTAKMPKARQGWHTDQLPHRPGSLVQISLRLPADETQSWTPAGCLARTVGSQPGHA